MGYGLIVNCHYCQGGEGGGGLQTRPKFQNPGPWRSLFFFSLEIGGIWNPPPPTPFHYFCLFGKETETHGGVELRGWVVEGEGMRNGIYLCVERTFYLNKVIWGRE